MRGTPAYYEDKNILAPQGLRRCRQCTEIRTLAEFWCTNGLYSRSCKICTNAKQRKWRETYKDTNTEKKRERAKRWRGHHPELFKARIADWHYHHPEYRMHQARKRRAIKAKNGVYNVTLNDLMRLRQSQHNLCYICHESLIKPELDHIIPIAKGGRHAIGNLAWACHCCNRKKSAKFLVEVRYR